MVAEKIPNDEKLLRGVIRLNAKVYGLVLGIVLGLIIFIGTNWLLIKGGPPFETSWPILYWLSGLVFGKHHRLFIRLCSWDIVWYSHRVDL
jgi:hypothetical protein